MLIYLAGFQAHKNIFFKVKPKYILESFYYIKNNDFIIYRNNIANSVLLDSGAFTYMNTLNKKVNFDDYVEKYAKYIYENNIKLYFEMDIDLIIEYEKVKEYRKFLEEKTRTKSIPVWHKSRGIEEFKKLTKEYDYIAIGGLAIKHIKRSEYKYLNPLINIAHKNDCKVHGLGFTNTKLLKSIYFDTVDSTTWNRGRFGEMCIYEKGEIKYIQRKKERIKNQTEASEFNLMQWKLYAQYMEDYKCII
jgi:hypothetical protein